MPKSKGVKYLPSEQSTQTQWCHQRPSCILGVGGERPAAWRLLSWGLWGGWSGPLALQNSPSVPVSEWVRRLAYAYSSPEETDLINSLPWKQLGNEIFTIPVRTSHTRSLSRLHEIPAWERWWSYFLSWASIEHQDWWGDCRNLPPACRKFSSGIMELHKFRQSWSWMLERLLF